MEGTRAFVVLIECFVGKELKIKISQRPFLLQIKFFNTDRLKLNLKMKL